MFEIRFRTFISVFFAMSLAVSLAICDRCPPIKTKAEWAGRLATNVAYQLPPIRFVSIHHTATGECSTFLECSELVQNIQTYAMNDLDFDDISYNFLIGNDGNIYEGTGWGVRASHTYGYNMNGTGIAFIGTFSAKLPSASALNAAKSLLACGVETRELDRNYRLFGALQVSATKSPGLALYNEIRTWPNWVQVP